MYEFYLSKDFGLIFLLVCLATEAIIELVKESEISRNIIHRNVIFLKEKYDSIFTYTLYKYVTCGQCMSVVYSIPGSIFISLYVYNNRIGLSIIPMFVIFLFSIHRASNWLNTLYKVLYRGRVTTIQFLDPIGIIDMSRVDRTDMDYVLNRELSKVKPKDVIVNNLSDVKNVIKNLKLTKPEEGKDLELEIDDNKFRFKTSTNHPTYMQMLIDMLSESEQEDVVIELNSSEKIVASKPQLSGSVNSLITRLTGGERDGDRIKWDINGDVYYYHPKFDVLTMKSDE
jgi:hypothetical protein